MKAGLTPSEIFAIRRIAVRCGWCFWSNDEHADGCNRPATRPQVSANNAFIWQLTGESRRV